MKQKVNWIAVVIGTVVMQIIPMIWYGMIWRDQWMAHNHITMEFAEAHKAESGGAYAAGLLAAFVGVYMLARLFILIRVEQAMRGLIIASSIGFSFTILPLMCVNLFSYRPYALSWIDGLQFCIGYAVSGILLAQWRTYSKSEA